MSYNLHKYFRKRSAVDANLVDDVSDAGPSSGLYIYELEII